MPTPEEMERITNNIIEVLLRLDKEVREYNYKTENFARRINAIDNMLAKADADFGHDFVAMIVSKVVSHIEQPLDLNDDVLRSLLRRGCCLRRAYAMYKWVEQDPIKAMGFNV